MFEFLLRKTVLRKLNREDQDIALVLKDEIQLSVLCFLALITVLLMPCVLLLVICFLVDETLVNSGCIIFTFFAYYGFVAWLIYKFVSEISIFMCLIHSKKIYNKRGCSFKRRF